MLEYLEVNERLPTIEDEHRLVLLCVLARLLNLSNKEVESLVCRPPRHVLQKEALPLYFVVVSKEAVLTRKVALLAENQVADARHRSRYL